MTRTSIGSTTAHHTSGRALAAGGALAVAVLLTACGSGGSAAGGGAYGGGVAPKTSPTSTPASPAAAAGVSVASTPAGKALVDPNGRTMYGFAADSKGTSVCTGSCLAYWPAVPGSVAAQGTGDGVTATLGTITRADGTKQLTVNGWPMYTYAGDTSPGDADGQGVNASGGLWWVVAPSGDWVTTSSASPSASDGQTKKY